MPPMLLSWISPTHPPLVAKHDGGCPWWLQFSAVLQDSIISFPLYLLKFSYSRETGQDWSTHDTHTITCGQHMTPNTISCGQHMTSLPSSVVNTWLHYHLMWSTHDTHTITYLRQTHMSISSLFNTHVYIIIVEHTIHIFTVTCGQPPVLPVCRVCLGEEETECWLLSVRLLHVNVGNLHWILPNIFSQHSANLGSWRTRSFSWLLLLLWLESPLELRLRLSSREYHFRNVHGCNVVTNSRELIRILCI